MNLELQQELFGWVELFVGSVLPALLLLLCICGRRLRVGCWLLPVAVLLGWAGLFFIWERYGFPISIAAAEARHDADYEPNGVGLLFLGWLAPFLPCVLTLVLVYPFRVGRRRLLPPMPPNHALQRTEAGGEATSDLRA